MRPDLDAIVRNHERLAALRKTALLDTLAEPAFDRFARLATRLLDIPVALVTLVDGERQFFKSCISLVEPWASQRETPLSHSFCQHTVVHQSPFIVEDARVHPVVNNNLAIPDLNVVAYAGIPLITSDGHVLGAFCAIDTKPRVWSADDITLLEDLAASVMTEIELRNEIDERRRVEEERAALLVSEQVARSAAEVAQRAAEAAQARLAFLAEASKLLGSALVHDLSLASLARLAVPAHADYCEVYVLGEHGNVRSIKVAAGDPTKEEVLREVVQRYPLDPRWERHPIAQVLRTGTTAFVPELSDEYVAAMTRDAEHQSKLCLLAPKSLVAVPIQLHRQVLGIIIYTMADSDRRYTRDDLALLEEAGRRMAVAINNTWLYQETVAAVRARDEVLSIVSHDLKNPLSAIGAHVEVMKRSTAKTAVSKSMELGEGFLHIEGLTRRMHLLINDLLDIAHLQVNQPLILDCRWTDLVTLVAQVVSQQEQISRHPIRIEAGAAEVVGLFDVDRLERVLVNLLDNATKYSSPGSEVLVTVTGGNDVSGWAVLEVRDHGIGIAAAELPYIFDRFYRGATAVTMSSGTGIGLASVRQIVEQHGGTVTVTGNEGGGCIFTVQLPLRHTQSHSDSLERYVA